MNSFDVNIDHKVTKRLIKLWCMTYRVAYRIKVFLDRDDSVITSGACSLCYDHVAEREVGWQPPIARLQETELHLLNECCF